MSIRLNVKMTAVVSVALILVGAYLRLPVPAVKIDGDTMRFPQVIGAWQSMGAPLSTEDLSVLGADVNLARQYRSGDGNPVELYLAYFETQAQAKELTGDRVERFVLGGTPVEDSLTPFNELELRRVVQQRGSGYRVVVCWYEMDGHSRADAWWVVLRTMWNGVFHRRTNGAIVVVETDYESAEQLQYHVEQLGAFIKAALPEIKNFLTTI